MSNVEEKYHTGQRKHVYNTLTSCAASLQPLFQCFLLVEPISCPVQKPLLLEDQGEKKALTFSHLGPRSIWNTLILIILVLRKY